jgi:hypothetical protein
MKAFYRQAIFLLLSSLCIEVYGQKESENVTPYRAFDSYRDPSPGDYAPRLISSQEAAEEKSFSSVQTGISEAYFSKAEILSLLDQNQCVGLRFYNVLENASGNDGQVVAVAVRADGSEIAPSSSNKYCLSQGPQGKTIRSAFIDKSTARVFAENAVRKGSWNTFNTYFSKSELQQLLRSSDAYGLKLIPGHRQFELPAGNGTKTCYTLSAAPINSDLNEIGSEFQKSIIPCPTYCADDDMMLSPARY